MKRKGYLIFIVLFIQSSLVFTPLNAELIVGDCFNYNIVSAGYYLEIGENKTIIDGFLFHDEIYPIDTTLNATVRTIESHGVGFKIMVFNRTSYPFLSGNWFDVLAVEYSYYALYNTLEMVEDFSRGFWVDLTLFQIRPFVDPRYSVYLDSPEALGEDIIHKFHARSWQYQDIEYSYDYTIADEMLYFESWIGGKIDDEFGWILDGRDNMPMDIKFGNNYHFAVDRESGIVHGFGRRGWVNGEINNTSVKVSMTCEYELDGYNLPKYEFGNFRNFLVGNTGLIIGIIVPAILIPSGVIFVIIYRRKKKAN